MTACIPDDPAYCFCSVAETGDEPPQIRGHILRRREPVPGLAGVAVPHQDVPDVVDERGATGARRSHRPRRRNRPRDTRPPALDLADIGKQAVTSRRPRLPTRRCQRRPFVARDHLRDGELVEIGARAASPPAAGTAAGWVERCPSLPALRCRRACRRPCRRRHDRNRTMGRLWDRFKPGPARSPMTRSRSS